MDTIHHPEYASLIKTLWDLDQAFAEMEIDIMEIRVRIRQINDAYRDGIPLKDSFPQGRSILVRRLTDLSRLIDRHGSRVRRGMALQLVREDVSPADIARLFGVSRQRISKILQEVQN